MNNLVAKLEQLLDGDVDASAETLKTYSVDTSIFELVPTVVVYPKHEQDIERLVLFVTKHEGLSLTARSAGTDMTGGPLNTSIIVDMLRYFNTIGDIQDNTVTVDPGVFYRDFEKHTLKQGLLLPCYTASKELNTVGGMVGNNSGGEKSLTYGKTDQYIKRLRMVMFDGNTYEFKKLTRTQWEEKKKLTTAEGELYRSIDLLLSEHKETIDAAKPDVSKNSAGYYLWNIYDETSDTFDLTQLIVGSQGTLGIITEIKFDLIQPKPESRMLVIFMRKKHLAQLGDVVTNVLEYKPESFEAYDDHTFGVLLKVFPSMMKRLGGSIFSLAWKFLPDMKAIIFGGIPKLVLMAEFTGDTAAEIDSNIYQAQERIAALGLRTHVTRNKSDSEKYWVIRRESFNLLRQHVHGKHTAPFIDDMTVAPQYLPEFLPRLYEIMDEYKITYTIAGHVGDGNFHIIPLMNFSRPDFAEIIYELSARVYTLVSEYHGSITGEHNDGFIRTPYLEQMYGPDVVALFEQTKNIFDPHTIFNPGKKVGTTKDQMKTYIKKQ